MKPMYKITVSENEMIMLQTAIQLYYNNVVRARDENKRGSYTYASWNETRREAENLRHKLAEVRNMGDDYYD